LPAPTLLLNFAPIFLRGQTRPAQASGGTPLENQGQARTPVLLDTDTGAQGKVSDSIVYANARFKSWWLNIEKR
jgi:hypothetical protein